MGKKVNLMCAVCVYAVSCAAFTLKRLRQGARVCLFVCVFVFACVHPVYVCVCSCCVCELHADGTNTLTNLSNLCDKPAII